MNKNIGNSRLFSPEEKYLCNICIKPMSPSHKWWLWNLSKGKMLLIVHTNRPWITDIVPKTPTQPAPHSNRWSKHRPCMFRQTSRQPHTRRPKMGCSCARNAEKSKNKASFSHSIEKVSSTPLTMRFHSTKV